MSLNVTITLPLETIQALQALTGDAINPQLMTTITQADHTAVKSLPFRIEPNGRAVIQKKPIRNITIKMLTGTLIHLSVRPQTTVRRVMELIEMHEGLPVQYQKLIYKNSVICRQPEDDGYEEMMARTLEEIGIEDEAMIHLVITLRGS